MAESLLDKNNVINDEEQVSHNTEKDDNLLTKKYPRYKQLYEDFKISDVVWAKVSKFPYWPSIICIDPESKTFIKRTKKRAMIHVRFCNDNGRRSWIQQVEKYDGKKYSDYKSSIKNKRQIHLWNGAVEEANYLITFDQDKRLVEFFKMFFILNNPESQNPNVIINQLPAKKYSGRTTTTMEIRESNKRRLAVSEQDNNSKIIKTDYTFVNGNTFSSSINSLLSKSDDTDISDISTINVCKDKDDIGFKMKNKISTKMYPPRSTYTNKNDSFDANSSLSDNAHGHINMNKSTQRISDNMKNKEVQHKRCLSICSII